MGLRLGLQQAADGGDRTATARPPHRTPGDWRRSPEGPRRRRSERADALPGRAGAEEQAAHRQERGREVGTGDRASAHDAHPSRDRGTGRRRDRSTGSADGVRDRHAGERCNARVGTREDKAGGRSTGGCLGRAGSQAGERCAAERRSHRDDSRGRGPDRERGGSPEAIRQRARRGSGPESRDRSPERERGSAHASARERARGLDGDPGACGRRPQRASSGGPARSRNALHEHGVGHSSPPLPPPPPPPAYDPALDFLSTAFDAARALRTPNLAPPEPAVAPLDNLSKCRRLLPVELPDSLAASKARRAQAPPPSEARPEP